MAVSYLRNNAVHYQVHAQTHDAHADAAAYDEIYRVSTTTPGVRSLRGNQYHLVARC